MIGWKNIFQLLRPDAFKYALFHYKMYGLKSLIKLIPVKLKGEYSSDVIEKGQPTGDVFEIKEQRRENLLVAGGYGDRKKRILYIEEKIPDPTLGSGFPRSMHVLSTLLQLGYSVTLFPIEKTNASSYAINFLQQKGIEVLSSDFEIGNFLKKRKGFFDMAFVCRPRSLYVSKNLLRKAGLKIIYDSEAISALREIGFLGIQGEQNKSRKELLLRNEINLVRNADCVLSVSEKEKALFEKYGIRNVHVLGHVLDVKASPADFDERRDFLFVGGILGSPSPNEDAVLYFLDKIFPKLRNNFGCKFYIAGSNKSESIWRLNSKDIIVTGHVENLSEYYNQCRVFVAPTRYGAGIPLKVLEASSYGIPTVTTALLADQLGWSDSVQILVAKNSVEFIEKCSKLYEDKVLWGKIRENAIAQVKKDFQREKFVLSLKTAIQSLD